MSLTVSSERVTFAGADGEPCGGVLARTARDGSSPAVLLMPAIAGVNDYVERVARDLAGLGYPCLALDYYEREGGPPDLSSGERILDAVAALPDQRVRADMLAATAYLRGQSFVDASAVAVLGFCIGGTYALLAGVDQPDLACAIGFYGQLRYRERTDAKPVSPLDEVVRIGCPVLAHYGSADHLIPRDDVAELQQRLAGKPAEVYVYPGAGHAFHEDFRAPVYRPVAAADAWRRSLTYLSAYAGAARGGGAKRLCAW